MLQANEDTPQIYSLCGRGPRSTLRVLRHGLAVTVMAVSELPGNPSAVWTVKVKLAFFATCGLPKQQKSHARGRAVQPMLVQPPAPCKDGHSCVSARARLHVCLSQGSHKEDHDRYIVVSFTNASLVLSIGDTVEEVTDSGFLATAPTLEVVLLEDDGLLQVHSNGIRHIRQDKRVNEWRAPGKKTVERASANGRQVRGVYVCDLACHTRDAY